MAKKILKKLVSIIIVTYNRKQLILACLQSVYKLNYSKFEVILVDNGSWDQTIEAVKSKFPQVKIIASKINLGLNAAKNLGQKSITGNYILFLDSDTLVDKNLLTEMVKLAESNPGIGLVCPKIYYIKPKNVIWYAGASVNLLTSQTKNRGCNQLDKGQFDQVAETQFAPTAYLATRKTTLALGGHDISLFMTYGDTDYGFRAKQAGFKVIFCPKAKLWHQLKQEDNNKTVRRLGYNATLRAYYFSRNRIIFMKKHAPKINFLIFLLIFFPAITFYLTIKIISFHAYKFLIPHWQGTFDGLKYLVNGKVKNSWQ